MQKRLGIWMWSDLPAAQGAAHAVEACAFAEVTDIFLLVKGLSGSACCAPIGGVLGVAYPGRDVLAEMLEAAHARGIRVHAWLTSASDALYKAAHPQSGVVHWTRGRDRDIIAISDDAYARYMETFVGALVERYPLDGLHLDYIRYNHAAYGWSDEDVARYEDAGVNVEHMLNLARRTFVDGEAECLFDAYRQGDESAIGFARVRRQNVVRFAQRLIAVARAERPALCISAALMPEGAYADTAFSDIHYGQNYQDAAALYDLALPMAYSYAYAKDAEWVAMVARGTAARGLNVLAGLHAYEGATGESLAMDLGAVSRLCQENSLRGDSGGGIVQGAALFRAGTVAFARDLGKRLRVYNALDRTITGLRTQHGNIVSPVFNVSIAPHTEAMFPLTRKPAFIRAFCGDDEACVMLV